MDEVDGMSAGDRGGVGALCQLIRKTKVFRVAISYEFCDPLLSLDSDYLYRERQRRSKAEASSPRCL